MDDKLNVGVIGLRVGQDHLDGYLTHPNAHIQAVCDVNPEALERVGTKYGIDARYTSYEEMFEKESLDIVSIATPNRFHKEMTLLALEKGMHVLCEKPIGLNAEEAIAMHQKSQETGKRLMVNYTYRFIPSSVAIKQRIKAGLVGDIYSTSCHWLRNIRGFSQFGGWFGKKSMSGGGVLIDIGVHCLDKALWLMDFPEVKSVTATTHDYICRKAGFDVEDTVEAFIKFTNGASLMLQVSWAANIFEDNLIEFRVLGEKEGILERNINQGYTFNAKTFYEADGISYTLNIDDISSDLCPSSMNHFVDAIVNNKPHQGNTSEAITVMKIIDAVYKSSETGDPIFFT
ncbi:MAG: Gfo/Idh/MocA family oxidoreductase [Cyanobacteria bacterium P01_F01_bin.150]